MIPEHEIDAEYMHGRARDWRRIWFISTACRGWLLQLFPFDIFNTADQFLRGHSGFLRDDPHGSPGKIGNYYHTYQNITLSCKQTAFYLKTGILMLSISTNYCSILLSVLISGISPPRVSFMLWSKFLKY